MASFITAPTTSGYKDTETPTRFSKFFNDVRANTSKIRAEAKADSMQTSQKIHEQREIADSVAHTTLERGEPIITSTSKLLQIAKDQYNVMSGVPPGEPNRSQNEISAIKKLTDAMIDKGPIVETSADALAADNIIKSPEVVRKEFFEMLQDRTNYIEMMRQPQSYAYITNLLPFTSGVALGTATLIGGFKLIGGYEQLFSSTTDRSFLTAIIQDNLFRFSANICIVGIKAVKYLTENDFENWSTENVGRTLAAGGLEFFKMSSQGILHTVLTEGSKYLAGAAIVSSGLGIIGFIILEMYLVPKINKWVSVQIKRILIKQDVFEDFVVQQVMTDELLMQKHKKALIAINAGSTPTCIWYNYFLPCLKTFADRDVFTMAACAIPLNLQAFLHAGFTVKGVGLTSEMVDGIVNTVILRPFLAPAVVNLACRLLARNSVKRMVTAPASKIWQKLVPPDKREYWESIATHYEFARFLGLIGTYFIKMKGMVIAGNLITVENYRGTLLSTIENVWGVPDVSQDLIPFTEGVDLAGDVLFGTNEHIATLLLVGGPSSTMKMLSEQLTSVELERNKKFATLSYSRLTKMQKDDFTRLDDEGKAMMAKVAGVRVEDFTTFDSVSKWRTQHNLGFFQRINLLLAGGIPEITETVSEIEKLEKVIENIKMMQKSTLLAEVYAIKNLQIPIQTILTAKSAIPLNMVKDLEYLYKIDNPNVLVEDGFNWQMIQQRLGILHSIPSDPNTSPTTFLQLSQKDQEKQLESIFTNLTSKERRDITTLTNIKNPTINDYKTFVKDFMLENPPGETKSRWEIDYDTQLRYTDLTQDGGATLKKQLTEIYEREGKTKYPAWETVFLDPLGNTQNFNPNEIIKANDVPLASKQVEITQPPPSQELQYQEGVGVSTENTREAAKIADLEINTRIQSLAQQVVVSVTQKQEFEFSTKGLSLSSKNDFMYGMMFGGADAIQTLINGISSFQTMDMKNDITQQLKPDRMLDNAKKNAVGMQTCLLGQRMKLVPDINNPNALVVVNEDGTPADPNCLQEPYLFQSIGVVIQASIEVLARWVPVVGPWAARFMLQTAAGAIVSAAGILSDTYGCLGSPAIPKESGKARQQATFCNINNMIMAIACKVGVISGATGMATKIGGKWCDRVAVYVDAKDVVMAAGGNPLEALQWFQELSLKVSRIVFFGKEEEGLPVDDSWFQRVKKLTTGTFFFARNLIDAMSFFISSLWDCPAWMRPFLFGSSNVSTLAQSLDRLVEGEATVTAPYEYAKELMNIVENVLTKQDIDIVNKIADHSPENVKQRFPELFR